MADPNQILMARKELAKRELSRRQQVTSEPKRQFNLGEALAPMTDASKIMHPTRAAEETLGNVYSQAKDIGLDEVGVPKSGIQRLLSGLGIDLVSGAVSGGGIGASKSIVANAPARMLTKASKLEGKARNILTEILQPKTSDVALGVERESVPKSILEGIKEVKPSKTYSGLVEQFKSGAQEAINKRNLKFAERNFSVGQGYIKPAVDLYAKISKTGQATSSELNQMADVLHKEYQFLFSKKGQQLSRIEAQERKELLQELTENLLEKRSAGETTITEPARKQMLDSIRHGLMKAVEGNDPEIRTLNKQYAGLSEAKSLAAEQEALALKGGPHSFIKDLLAHVIRPSKLGTGAAIAREAFRREASLGRQSGKASKLYKKAITLRDLAGKRIREE